MVISLQVLDLFWWSIAQVKALVMAITLVSAHSAWISFFLVIFCCKPYFLLFQEFSNLLHVRDFFLNDTCLHYGLYIQFHIQVELSHIKTVCNRHKKRLCNRDILASPRPFFTFNTGSERGDSSYATRLNFNIESLIVIVLSCSEVEAFLINFCKRHMLLSTNI